MDGGAGVLAVSPSTWTSLISVTTRFLDSLGATPVKKTISGTPDVPRRSNLSVSNSAFMT
eukprot:269603-Hanusia_phi.AAC.1